MEAVIEAGLAANDQGFQHIFFLSDSKGLSQIIKKESAFDWLDSTRLADFCFLNQNGLHCDVFWVPSDCKGPMVCSYSGNPCAIALLLLFPSWLYTFVIYFSLEWYGKTLYIITIEKNYALSLMFSIIQ